jgi:hypothetical protein
VSCLCNDKAVASTYEQAPALVQVAEFPSATTALQVATSGAFDGSVAWHVFISTSRLLGVADV